MAEYQLPDGKVLSIPDDTTLEGYQKIQTHLSGLYPEHYQPYKEEADLSYFDKAIYGLKGLAQTPEAIARGALNTALTANIGLSSGYDLAKTFITGRDTTLPESDDGKLTAELKNIKGYINADPSADSAAANISQAKLLSKIDPKFGGISLITDYLKGKAGINESLLAPNEEYRDSNFNKFPEGLGSGLAFMTTAATSPWTGLLLGGASYVGEQEEMIERAREKGIKVTPTQELGVKGLSFVGGLSEVLVPQFAVKMLRGFSKSDSRNLPFIQQIKDVLKKSAQGAAFEGVQETLAGIYQNAIAKGIYDPTIDIYDSWVDDLTVGAFVGGVLVGGSRAAHHKMQQNQALEYETNQAKNYDEEQKASDEIIRQKIILAAEQGDQVIDPALVPDAPIADNYNPYNQLDDKVKPEGVEIPVLETFNFVPNADGTINVVGQETKQTIGTFSNIEEASQAATEKTKQNRNEFIIGFSEQVTSINGLAGNGTASNIGRKLYDPLNNLIDAKVLANFDVRVSDKRQAQAQKEKLIEENEQAGQSKLASELMDNMDTTGLSIEELSQIKQDLEIQLSKQQAVYPISGNKIDPESTLALFWESAEKSGIGAKNFYTVKEAKKLLNKSDFNQFMSEKSNIKFEKIKSTGEMKPVKRIKDKIDVSQKAFDNAFESKNIEVSYTSPAFKYLAETFTGDTNLSNMSIGQKEMLMARIKNLPRFNNKTKLPNFTPRPYTAEQIDAFYNQYQGNRFSNNDIKLAIKNNTNGKDLTPKQINEFKTDLIESGRATKDNNKLSMTNDFKIQQARKAESYSNETTDEFKSRLVRTTLLTPEQIEEVVNDDAIYKEGVIDSSDVLALPSPEPMQKYSELFKLMRKRLIDRNLGDVALKFDRELKASLNIKQKGNKYFYEPVDLDKSKGKPTAVYDRPLNKIILSIEAINPDGTMSEAELGEELRNKLDHESVHALIQLGILTQKEVDMLFKDAKKLLPKDFQKKLINAYTGKPINEINDAYLKKDFSEDLKEELVAEFIRISGNNPSQLISPKSKTIINKIINFLTTLGQTIYDAGFTSSRTIIRDIESGKIGARERGVLRNTQRVRSRNEQKYGIARPSAEQLDTSLISKYKDVPNFSREERETLQKEINKLNNKIAEKIRRYDLDYAYLPDTTARIDQNEIVYLEKKRDITVEKLKSLKPTQLDFPLFSRMKPVKLDEKNSILIKARVGDQDIELRYADKSKIGGLHRVDEETEEGFFNWVIYSKPTTRNSPMRSSVRWLLQSFKNNGWQDGKRKKKWKKTESLQDVADFLNKEQGLTENDRGYISVDDDAVGDITIREDKNYPNAYNGLLSIEIEDKAKGKGIGQAVVEMVASTNPDILKGTKQLRIMDITPEGRPFWEAIGTKVTYRSGSPEVKGSTDLSPLDGDLSFPSELENLMLKDLEMINEDLEMINEQPLFSRGPRDESSGHVADFLPAQYGPPAHQLDLEASGELTSEGYSTASFGFTYPKTSPDYRTREFKIYSTARTPQEIQEEREFVIKLMEIKGNPNATITMYQAAPSRDLRKGDLITPFLSDAQYYVDQSKVTQEEVRDADKARRRQEQINKTGAVDLQQERLFNQMEGISDILGRPSQATPSTIHTYELKAGDVRWDGNNGWARWGYFPSNVVGIDGNIPLFSRVSDIENKYINEDIKLDIFETENEIKLSKIIVSERNMGVGTSVMNDLTNYADINNKVITLTPSKDFGATSVNRLKTFYKRFGFVENKGRNKDFSYRDSMYRLPQTSQDIPLFSRAATDTSPAYADFFEIFEDYSRGMETNDHFNVLLDTSEISWQERSEYRDGNTSNYFARYIKAKEESAESGQLVSFDGRDDIVLELETREKYNLETFPRVFVMRMPINDFIKLTTPDDLFIEEQITPYIKDNKFDPLEFGYSGDTPFSFPVLAIDSKGQVTGHDGRGRSLTALQDGATEVPVILFIERGKDDNLQENYKFMGNQIDDFTPMTLGIGALFPQKYQGINNRPETFGKTQFRKDYFFDLSRFKDYDIAPLNPLYSITGRDTQNRRKNQMEANKQTVNMINPPIDSSQDTPLFSRENPEEIYNEWRSKTYNPKTLEQTEEELKEYVDSLPPSIMPRWNKDAHPVSLRVAFDFQEGIDPVIMTDAPSYSRSDKEIPNKYKEIDEAINGTNNTPDETFADAIIDIAETKEEVGSFLSRMRAEIIDEFSIPEKTVLKLGKASAKIRELNSRAISGAIQALRMSKKGKGVHSQMMMRGVPVLVDEQGNPVPKGSKNFGGTKVIDFKHGGFVKIIGQLHTTEYGEDLMRLFKMYRIGLRGTRLNKEGKEVVLTPEQLELATEIGKDFPIIQIVSDQYSEYNNAILDYAVQTGILSEEITINQLIENISSNQKVKITKNDLTNLAKEARKNELTDEQFRQELLILSSDLNIKLEADNKIETRGTAEIWKDNADYYPFYRKMADDSIQGPAVAGGFLSGNPLNIEIKGSKKAIEPEPLEVMARNMQSIVTAAMKNEGLSRLMEVYEEGKIAKKILLKDKKSARDLGSDVISVFENGEQIHYQVADPIFTMGLQAFGMTQDAGLFMKVIGLPSNILRESITRDPGFIIKNMLRDTLSSAVTSGANFIPIVDTFKGFAADLSELERFGVIGGYDAANDRQDVVKKIKKIKREQGLDVYDEEGNFAIDQVVKLWDFMGGLTTRSDGSTRKAVADSILELTGDQVEAAYQALEIINFDRRGFNPYMRIVTTAIPFLNARIQGLDVLYRSGTGQYSSKISEIAKNTTPDEVAKSIILTTVFRGGMLTLATLLYYALIGDEERYEGERQSVRDDNWLIPTPDGLPPLKFPIPFEVGFIFKTVPERILDYSMTKFNNPNYGNTTGKQLEDSISRGITTTLKLDPTAWQIFKPLKEVSNNKSGFTGNPIVPPFMEEGIEPYQQYTTNTSSFAIALGDQFNVSPIKIDYLMNQYTGTIGTYLLNIADIGVRKATGREYVAPYLTQLPVVKSLFASQMAGGLQEQYYEMRSYSNMVIQTINDMEKKGRIDELIAYTQSHKGALGTRDEILRIEKFMKQYRADKLSVQISKLSPEEKREIIKQLDEGRNLRLSIVPFLVKQTDQPSYLTGLMRN